MNFPTNLSSLRASSPEEIEDPEIGEEAGGRLGAGDDGGRGAGADWGGGAGTAVLLGVGAGGASTINDVEVEGSSHDVVAGGESAKSG